MEPLKLSSGHNFLTRASGAGETSCEGNVAKGISAGEFAFVDESLARILSRDPLPLKEFIRNL